MTHSHRPPTWTLVHFSPKGFSENIHQASLSIACSEALTQREQKGKGFRPKIPYRAVNWLDAGMTGTSRLALRHQLASYAKSWIKKNSNNNNRLRGEENLFF